MNKCTHKKWLIDEHNIGTCEECGEVRKFPFSKDDPVIVLKKGKLPGKSQGEKKPMRKDIQERHKYYEANKETIIADLLSIGRSATRDKWSIPGGTTLTVLEKRWMTQEQRAQIPHLWRKRGAQHHHPAVSADGKLPSFPEFSPAWDPTVQVKWLEVYELLTRHDEAKRASSQV